MVSSLQVHSPLNLGWVFITYLILLEGAFTLH